MNGHGKRTYLQKEDYSCRLKLLILTHYRTSKAQLHPKEPLESEIPCAKGQDNVTAVSKPLVRKVLEHCIKFQ